MGWGSFFLLIDYYCGGLTRCLSFASVVAITLPRMWGAFIEFSSFNLDGEMSRSKSDENNPPKNAHDGGLLTDN